MREIKFRAWDNLEKEMWSPEKVEDFGPGFSSNGHPEGFTYLQYTGLKDKNGVEIYEGDIVETNRVNVQAGNDYNPYIRQVKFDDEYGGFYFYLITGEKQSAGSVFCKKGLENNWEVIGNIYETPELLKEDK